MKDIKKLIIFVLLFIFINCSPFIIVINKIPMYVIWVNNAALTMYLLSVKSKGYKSGGIIISAIIEFLTYNIVFFIENKTLMIHLAIVAVFLNTLNAYIIYRVLNKSGKLVEVKLNEIIKITFFKVVPSIVIVNLIQNRIFYLYVGHDANFTVINFILSNLLGYVFIFTIFYVMIKGNFKSLRFNTKFIAFIAIDFAFNTQEVYFKSVFDMNRSHIEYISIFILVLACIILKAEEFLMVITEDFILSFFMISLFTRELNVSLKEYLLSDLQLFYVAVLTTCFFLIILKHENSEMVKVISVANSKLQDEAKENKEMLKKVDILIDSIKNTAFIADEDGNIIYSNNSFKNIIKEDNLYKIELFDKIIYDMKKRGVSRKREEIIIDKYYYMQEVFISEYDGSKVISGVGTDITRLKKIQGKLKKSKEEAEKANMAKGSLLARVSHELKTPINTITGITYLLSESLMGRKEKEYTKKIEKAAIILLKMIDDILDVSRNDNSSLKIENNIISLAKVINTVVYIKEDEIMDKGLKLIEDIDKNIPKTIIGDEFRLEQILLNLIGNSIKFTDEGYIKLSVKVIDNFKNICTVKFTVEDSGIGISDEKKETIFEPFTQEDETITRKYGGTGLGLSVCKGIVESLKGEIILNSKKGVGTIFDIILPLEVCENEYYIENNGNGKLIEKTKDEINNQYKEDFDKIEALNQLEKLKYLSENDIGEAMDKIEEIYCILERTKYEKRVLEIKRLIDVFDVEKVEKAINILRDEIGESIGLTK